MLLLIFISLESILSVLSLILSQDVPHLRWNLLLSRSDLLRIRLDLVSHLNVLSDNLNQRLLVSDIELVALEDLNNVVKVYDIQKLNVIDLWLSDNLIEVSDDDVQTSIHHLGVIVLQGIHIQLEYRLLIQMLRNDQITQIFQQLVTAEGISLGVQGVEVSFCDFILNRFDVLSQRDSLG